MASRDRRNTVMYGAFAWQNRWSCGVSAEPPRHAPAGTLAAILWQPDRAHVATQDPGFLKTPHLRWGVFKKPGSCMANALTAPLSQTIGCRFKERVSWRLRRHAARPPVPRLKTPVLRGFSRSRRAIRTKESTIKRKLVMATTDVAFAIY